MSESFDFKKGPKGQPPEPSSSEKNYDRVGFFWSWGWRMALEWGAAVTLGGFLGASLDKFIETSPWGFVSGLFWGSITGLWNIYFSCQNHFRKTGSSPKIHQITSARFKHRDE